MHKTRLDRSGKHAQEQNPRDVGTTLYSLAKHCKELIDILRSLFSHWQDNENSETSKNHTPYINDLCEFAPVKEWNGGLWMRCHANCYNLVKVH